VQLSTTGKVPQNSRNINVSSFIYILKQFWIQNMIIAHNETHSVWYNWKYCKVERLQKSLFCYKIIQLYLFTSFVLCSQWSYISTVLTFGCLPSVCLIWADVSEPSVRSSFKPLKMDLTEGSETSANINQTLGKHPKVNTVDTEHSESLKSRIEFSYFVSFSHNRVFDKQIHTL
jgi:hypothetical protein